MIRDYPQYYKWFSVREFEHNGIKQQNRNGLLEKDPTVDGLKTGHTDSAGFCLVTSALRDGMRLVSVVMGSTSMKARENASAALLNYGFTFYDTKLIVKGGAALATARVWKGRSPTVDLGIKDDLYLTLPRGEADGVKTAAEVPAAPDRAARRGCECRQRAGIYGRAQTADDRAPASPEERGRRRAGGGA